MKDLKEQLWSVKKQIFRGRMEVLELPPVFSFRHGDVYDFNDLLKVFNWNLRDQPVKIDFRKCKSANYQALALLIPYIWRLKQQNCRVSFEFDNEDSGASEMWKKMGAQGLFLVSIDKKTNFRCLQYKPLIAIRDSEDFKVAMAEAETYTKDFDLEYKNTLHYVLSELLYNTLEHGKSYFSFKGKSIRTPSIIQFTWYATRNELQFIVADTGIGVKQHLTQAYPGIESDSDALRMALQPGVSGTFGSTDVYKAKNNAGVGLYISSNIIRRLKADMHVISGSGVIHISPRDVTTRQLDSKWPGTFVVVSIRLDNVVDFKLHSMMQELRLQAEKEVKARNEQVMEEEFYVHIRNFFGPYAEDKDAAIKFRDRRILPELKGNRRIRIDFEGVEGAPHSFLSALLATPIKIIGVTAYKRFRIINASPEIRETIDYILDENTE